MVEKPPSRGVGSHLACIQPAAEEVQRDPEMAAAVLRRANRRLTDTLLEMYGRQGGTSAARHRKCAPELDRLAGGIGKEQEAKHAEPGATRRDSGVERARSGQKRDRARTEAVAPDRTQGAAIELHERAGNPAGRAMVSVNFVVVPTIGFEILYVFLVLAHDRRRILHFGVTANPTAEWTAQQLREAFPWDKAPRYLLRDRGGSSGENSSMR